MTFGTDLPEGERRVSVLICTCNRRDNVLATVRSVLSSGYENLEVFVLDQSDDDETRTAVHPLTESDSRLRYVHLERANKPLALNHGRELSRGEYILITDDDCEAVSGWIEAAVRTFESDPRIGALYGEVLEGPYDPNEGYIPHCRLTEATSIFSVKEFLRMPGYKNFGMGANMAFRTRVLNEIGGWDPCIGPGAPFASGDDSDVAVRVLAAGHGIAFCPDSKTIHYGLRRWASWGKDQARYGFGMGAIFGKQLRCGVYYAGGARLLAQSLRDSSRQIRRLSRPFGLGYPRSWLRGVVAGLLHPMDRQTRCFRLTGEPHAPRGNRVAEVVLRTQQSQRPAAASRDESGTAAVGPSE